MPTGQQTGEAGRDANHNEVTTRPGFALHELLATLAYASEHAYNGDADRCRHFVTRALALLDEGLPPNLYLAELARLEDQADPATAAAFERLTGAA